MIEQLPRQELPVEERVKIVQKLDRDNWGVQAPKPTTVPDSEEQFLGGQEALGGRKTGVTG